MQDGLTDISPAGDQATTCDYQKHWSDAMSDSQETPKASAGPETSEQPVPAMQRILDNPFLLLFLGVTIPAVLYIIWGVMEVASVPIAN